MKKLRKKGENTKNPPCIYYQNPQKLFFIWQFCHIFLIFFHYFFVLPIKKNEKSEKKDSFQVIVVVAEPE